MDFYRRQDYSLLSPSFPLGTAPSTCDFAYALGRAQQKPTRKLPAQGTCSARQTSTPKTRIRGSP